MIFFYSLIVLLTILFFYIFRGNIYQIYNIYDYPDKKRKLHENKTSLSGGLLILFGVIFFYLQQSFFKEEFANNYLNFSQEELNLFLISSFMIFLVGYLDDYKNIKPLNKILLLILVLFFYIFFDKSLIIKELYFSFTDYKLGLGKFSIFFTIFSILLFINAYNLFDGIDLQAGTYALFIFMYLFFLTNLNYTLIPFIFFLLFFLKLNLKKEIFLGDAGSLLTSFILSYFIIKTFNKNENLFFCDQIFIIMILPGIEMLRLFINRIYNGTNPFKPDRNHLHHILSVNRNQYFAFSVIFLLYSAPVMMMILKISTIFSLFTFLLIYTFLLYFKFK